MKRALILATLVACTAWAGVTLTNQQDRGWQGKRGTSNVGAPHATEAACWTAMRADAEARKLSANYTCINTKAARLEYAAAPVVPPVVVPPVVVPPVVTPPAGDPHQGGMHSGSMPWYNPATIPPPAVGRSTRLEGPAGEAPRAADGNGAFRTRCQASHWNRDDSLLYPGRIGAAHLHLYWGNTNSDANTSLNSLLTSGNSTCRGGTMNRSTYWIPAVIDTSDGRVMTTGEIFVYYKRGYAGTTNEQIQPPPVGIQMIAGDMRRMDPFAAAWQARHYFECQGGNRAGTRDTEIPQNCTGELIVNLTFPQCWDGRNLTAPDHMSHMAYPNAPNGCPASHPVALPEVSYTVHFPIPAGRNTSNWRLSSDNYQPSTGRGGRSMHGDWRNGWDHATSVQWTREIINQGRDSSGHLGNGRQALD